jgi:3-oxoacyl-[acyl-carrier-protein] synthase II
VAPVVGGVDAGAARATYLGGATTHDAFHLVASEPEGRELERCQRGALADAGVDPADVAVVKAHGSGTPLNDGIEADLADRLFPARTRLCSYKPLVGHCMAAASLSELAGVLAGYEVGQLPVRVSDDPAHPRLADGEPPPDGLLLCTSVGLGGANASVVLDVHSTPGARA